MIRLLTALALTVLAPVVSPAADPLAGPALGPPPATAAAAIVFQHHFTVNRPDWEIVDREDGTFGFEGVEIEVRHMKDCRFELRGIRNGHVHQIDFGRLAGPSRWRYPTPGSGFIELTFLGRGDTVQAWEKLSTEILAKPGPVRWSKPNELGVLVIDVHGWAQAERVIQAVRDVRDACLPERQR